MERKEWILQELQRVYDQSQNYMEVALIKATQSILLEQYKRIEQMEGEMDGTLWSPKRWSE